MKKTILISSLIIIAVLLAEAYRENLNMEWQRYQVIYKGELQRLAKTPKEKALADAYKIKYRQIVLPELNRFDRCVSCHVGIENPMMVNVSQPLKTHPGNYLEVHDLEKVGCTICHDGQGRAVTFEEALAHGHDKYWEKPMLMKPFMEANCSRCHQDTLEQTPHYNRGKKTFEQLACLGCHKLNGQGGVTAPDISNIANASVHVKAPSHKNRERFLKKFNNNINIAYLYESLKEPQGQGQGGDIVMPTYALSESQIIDLVVYLKSLSTDNVAHQVLAAPHTAQAPQVAEKVSAKKVAAKKVPARKTAAPVVAVSPSDVKATVPTASVKAYQGPGKAVFQKTCTPCHTIGGGRLVGPDLLDVHKRYSEGWILKFIKSSQTMVKQGDAEAVATFEKFYKIIMPDPAISDSDIKGVSNYIKHASAAGGTAAQAVAVATQKAPPAITYEDVSREDVGRGRSMFQGKFALMNGGPSCISCHNVRNNGLLPGGTLAKDLTTVFSRMGGPGIKAILGSSPFPVMNQAYKGKPLTDEEISTLTAFLQQADQESADQVPDDSVVKMFSGGVIGMIVLLGLYSLTWRGRKRTSVNQDIFDRQEKSE